MRLIVQPGRGSTLNGFNKIPPLLDIASQTILAISYAGSGATKVAGAPPVKKEFAKWGYSRELRLLIGTSELLCAGLLLSRRTARTGAIGLAGLMLGAAFTHAKHREYIRIGIPLAAIYPLINLAIHAASE